MVAGQEHHRPAGIRQQFGAALQDPVGLAVVVENVAYQQNDVRGVGFRRLQHDPQAGGAVRSIGSLMRVVVDM